MNGNFLHRTFPRAVVLAATLCTAQSLADAVQAQESVKGAVRVSLDGTVFSTRSYKIYAEGPLDSNGDPGPAVEESVTSTGYGLPVQGFGLGIGYGASDDFIFGARLRLSSEKMDTSTGEPVETQAVGFLPYAEFMLGSNAFLLVEGGYEQSKSTSGDAEVTTTATLFGPGIGVRGFASPGFSLDASASFYGTLGSVENPFGTADFRGHAIVGRVTFSGWFLDGPATPVQPSNPSLNAPAEPDPVRRPPADTGVRERRGRIETAIAIANDAILFVEANPVIDPENVTMRLEIYGSETETCTELAARSGARSFPVSGVEYGYRANGPNAPVSVMVGSLEAAHLDAIVKSREPAVLDACGTEWRLKPPQVSQMEQARALIAQLREPSNYADGGPGIEVAQDRVTARVPLTEKAELSLSATSAKPNQVSVVLNRHQDEGGWNGCETMVVETSKNSLAVEDVALTGESLGGRLPLRAVLETAQSPQRPEIVTCGRRVAVGDKQQHVLWLYVQALAHTASQQGHWPPQ